MNTALIKDRLCVNVAVFDSIEDAKNMFGDTYDYIIECPEFRGINHKYVDGVWYDPQPEKIMGSYIFTPGIDVKKDDLVLEYDPSAYKPDSAIVPYVTYKALTDIKFQLKKPSELPKDYEKIVTL